MALYTTLAGGGTGSRRHMCLSVSASIRAERSVVTMMTDGRDVIDAS